MDKSSEGCDESSSGGLSESMTAKLRQTFRDEAYELLTELEAALLELEKAPQDQELVDRVFRAMHTIKGSSAACGLYTIASFVHELETFFDFVRKGTISVTKEIIDLTLSGRDQIKSLFDACYRDGTADEQRGAAVIASFKKLQSSFEHKDAAKPDGEDIEEDGEGLSDDADCKKLGDILVEWGTLKADDLRRVLATQKRFGELLVESGLGTPEAIEEALVEQRHQRELQKERRQAEESASIRVSTAKLDGLVDLVGELVTVQARLSQTALSHQIPELHLIAEQVERLTGDIHDKTMGIRMLPIGTTFGKFKRIVRDLSWELGKEIELATEGAETELDKTVIERLSDPLVHIIRNCIDHGIEPPDVREAAGKPRCGTIRLSGEHGGAFVLIRISDDGAGLDREAIRAKAVKQGLLSPDADPPDRELFPLIFSPGFSTAKKVSDVSGRGVGLDVVKKTIESFRGSIEVNSQRGVGTTVTLKLPLTLAIIEGLLISLAEQYYVLPLSFVKECVELTAADKKTSRSRRIANVRGDMVPYINLREQFCIEGEAPAIEQIVIAEADGDRVGFVVDSVIGGHQTVIKNLGTFYRDAEGVSGATILGDGTLALILDIPKLVRMAELQETHMTRGGAWS